jgi:DNA-binding transcriptional ArsR family regulator
MAEQPLLESTSLLDRVVLLGVAELAANDETPAYSFEIQRTCRSHLSRIDDDIVGDVSESMMMRTLNELAATELVAESFEDRSSVGKGRPLYEPVAPSSVVFDELATDERLEDVVAAIRGDEESG